MFPKPDYLEGVYFVANQAQIQACWTLVISLSLIKANVSSR